MAVVDGGSKREYLSDDLARYCLASPLGSIGLLSGEVSSVEGCRLSIRYSKIAPPAIAEQQQHQHQQHQKKKKTKKKWGD